MKRIALLSLTMQLLMAQIALATVPTMMTVQGKLTDLNSAPLPAGDKGFVFRIFGASSGGTQIWPSVGGEAQTIITNADGLWTASVGAVTPLTEDVFDGSERWLEITVNGTVLPRKRLVTAPYAQRVATVDGATGGLISGKVTLTGVGDGVEIQGPGIGDANEAYIRFGDQNGTQFGYVGDANPGNPDMYMVAHTGAIHLYTAAGTTLTAGANANVGIGATPDASEKLRVETNLTTAISGNSTHTAGNGVVGKADAAVAYGVWGISSLGSAGKFSGDVDVEGTLTKNAGSFKIDHPLDPANKYLSHSFVESPDMKNIYDGVAVLDSQGEAVVVLPDWFGALNRDIRYQLTCLGGFAPVYVAEKVQDNRFRIAGGTPGLEVSWQVTGTRQDAYANAHRIQVEETKPTAERGFYRNPVLFSQPEEKGIEWARRPEIMKEMKDESESAKTKTEQ